MLTKNTIHTGLLVLKSAEVNSARPLVNVKKLLVIGTGKNALNVFKDNDEIAALAVDFTTNFQILQKSLRGYGPSDEIPLL